MVTAISASNRMSEIVRACFQSFHCELGGVYTTRRPLAVSPLNTHLYIIHALRILYSGEFSYELPIRIFNIRTAQDSDVEPIVPGNFRSFNIRMMLYNMKNTEISTIQK